MSEEEIKKRMPVPPSVYKIQIASAGDLYIMPKPSGEWLRDDVKAYREIGISRIVSLLEHKEASDLGLSNEGDICEEFGIDFVQYPIRDLALPTEADFRELVNSTCIALQNGTNIAVHCRAGVGRSGMLSSCVLIKLAVPADEAVFFIGEARGVSIPDTLEQHQFIQNFTTGL